MQTAQPTPVNYWPQTSCARAFWGQHKLRPYRQLLADTMAWVDVQADERWLDLGCGCGQLTEAVWTKSGGHVAEVVALDCAAANVRAIARLRRRVRPPAEEADIPFVHADFSTGLAEWGDEHFDGVVSGLAIQYAESYTAERGWTTDAYDHLLDEVHRVLAPGGRFIFSVNVPEPSWGLVGVRALPWVFFSRHPLKLLKDILRMARYGGWLKHEARRGRFHYLPIPVIVAKLTAAGFTGIEYRLSYARQAYIVRCRKGV